MREHLSFANVMSCVAVFVALGGTALALKANSVGSRQVKPESLKAADIKDGSLRGFDLTEGTLSSREIDEAKFALGELTALESGRGLCDPETAAYENCGSTALQVAAPSRALLVVGGSQEGPPDSSGTCKARIGNQSFLDGTPVNAGDPAARGIGDPNGFAFTVASDQDQLLAPGTHTVSVLCNEIGDDVKFATTFTVLAISAVED